MFRTLYEDAIGGGARGSTTDQSRAVQKRIWALTRKLDKLMQVQLLSLYTNSLSTLLTS